MGDIKIYLRKTGEFGITWIAEISQYHPYYWGVVLHQRRWYDASFFLKVLILIMRKGKSLRMVFKKEELQSLSSD